MLRFSDPMREQSFTRKRMGSLRSNSLKLYCICLFVSSSSWVLFGFDTRQKRLLTGWMQTSSCFVISLCSASPYA